MSAERMARAAAWEREKEEAKLNKVLLGLDGQSCQTQLSWWLAGALQVESRAAAGAACRTGMSFAVAWQHAAVGQLSGIAYDWHISAVTWIPSSGMQM
jgi:hypothetical protein